MSWCPWGVGEEGSSSSAGSRTGACPRSQLQVSCQGWPWQLCGLCSAAALWSHQVPQPWEPQENCRICEGLSATLQGWSHLTVWDLGLHEPCRRSPSGRCCVSAQDRVAAVDGEDLCVPEHSSRFPSGDYSAQAVAPTAPASLVCSGQPSQGCAAGAGHCGSTLGSIFSTLSLASSGS